MYCRARPSRRDELLGLRAKVADQLAFLQPQIGLLEAIRDAVTACGKPGCFVALRAPATPEAVLAAIAQARA